MSDWEDIKHLYARAGFGLGFDESRKKENSSLRKALDNLFSGGRPGLFRLPSEYVSLQEKAMDLEGSMMKNFKAKNLEDKAKKFMPLVITNWYDSMADSRNPLLEKMTLFWHGHFACRSKLPHMAVRQVNTIRQHALGNFRDLVQAIAKDPSMILYLNNQQNNKEKPNENFARELMELFTIGIGNYSEKDVKEAGRAFTGWKADRIKAEYKFVARRHDFGKKTFMGQTGDFNGEDIINIILENKEVARFIARKIHAYFVNPKIDEKNVNEIADIFYNSDYDIKKTMHHIFSSDWFYASENIGVKIKSPIELYVGLKKILDIQLSNHKPLFFIGRGLGQKLFNPPNVAGWPGDKAWIDNATLMTRLNLPFYFIHANDVVIKGYSSGNSKPKKTIDLRPIFDFYKGKETESIVSDLIRYFIHPRLSADKKLLTAGLKRNTEKEIIISMVSRTLSLPEYQLC